jgi:aspartyl-tRNA(Asn)/glutamyl-tRNA(Gln) amidotransferase subunit A
VITESIESLNKKLLQKEISPVGLYRSYLRRIDQTEDELNAFVTVTTKEGLKDAENSEKRYVSKKNLGPLDGIPVGIKDVFCTKDVLTTASSKMLYNFLPPYDATVVTKLKEAGVVLIGKNNCDAWAHGASTEHSDFGVTANPWDPERVPGGSSGGSAAAVAAGECVFSIGSDTGGSIRQPAAFCGVVGLKPTYGRVSRYGLIAMGSSLDCVGPITNTVKDSATVLEIIAGKDDKDSTTLDIPVPKYTESLDGSLKGKKIGWVKEFYELGLEKEIEEAMLSVRKVFEKLGCEFVEVSIPHLKYGIPVYYIVQSAEVSSNLGRYDGIKYGLSTEQSTDLIDHYFETRDKGFGREAKRRIMLGTFVLSAGYYDAYYNKAMQVRTLIKEDFDKALEKVDVLVGPVTPTVAFKIGEKEQDPLQMYLADVFTAPVNLAGHPSISLPCAFSSENLPIGVQIIGKHFDEQTIFNFGHKFEQETLSEQWRKNKTVI